MHHRPLNRRTTVTATLSFLIIASLTYQYFYISGETQVHTVIKIESTACDVWPSSSTSQPDFLSYEECSGIVNTPHVGDRSVLGNPQECLLANTRLDQYRSSVGRNWSEVRWGESQSRCASESTEVSPYDKLVHQQWRLPPGSEGRGYGPPGDGRVAIVLRTWDNYEYTENRLAWLRTLIAEASLQREGNYRVFFLVNIKDPNVRLEEDGVVYDELMRKCIPSEFRDMAFLFNERTLKAWYPKIPEHGAQDQMYQALQIFSHKFPEYSHIWQLEMDLRMTGHVHDTLQSATTFARAQSRRNLWERNGRFYIPALHNNSYEDFARTVEAETTDDEIGNTGIWGPVSASDFKPQGPTPPPRSETDWGVGEEADLINFMPTIDPIGTEWVYENDIHGFVDGEATPRRLSIVSITRTSRRLLRLVSEAQQSRGQWLVSEATMETFTLLHGLKAVTVPHPIAFGYPITAEELDANINRGPPSNRAGGFLPSMLYTNMGWIHGPWWGSSYWFTGFGAQDLWDAYVGGERLPPLLLHPVKGE
ncbi:hypothetical protein F4859DRAFT_521137 [Xylaria cf. heliscus]|nr:hypothetical protein F4859DRAFT_521137 [Xylaria cf. heliscus]